MQEALTLAPVLRTNQTPPKVFVPGNELLAEIQRQRLRPYGPRTYWLAPGLDTPRLLTREAITGTHVVLRRETALYLRTGDLDARDSALQVPSAHAELKQIIAAVLRDLAGEKVDEVQTRLGYGSARGTQIAASQGRAKLARIGAWPWWSAAHVNRLEHVDQAMAEEPFLADSFAAWSEGRWLERPGS